LIEHPLVEFQPTEFAVDIVVRIWFHSGSILHKTRVSPQSKSHWHRASKADKLHSKGAIVQANEQRILGASDHEIHGIDPHVRR
jgi:hypothetical protein